MKTQDSLTFRNGSFSCLLAIACAAALLVTAYSVAYSQEGQDQAPAAANEEAPPMPPEQIDSLVAPIALYPDTLLAQTLAASTYPLEVMQLDQWMEKNKHLKDKALADAVAKQPWDPSVQAMAAFPDVVQRMAENIQWMTDLGNVVLAQQKDVMDAVQRMRAKAQGTGNLKTGSQQKVETKTTQSGQQVVVIEQANPEAVYVPSYDPEVVYGAAPADYPYYPYSYPGYQPGTALAWGTAIAVGGAWAYNNNWGNCDWDHGDVTINNNNNFNKNYNKNVNRGTGTGQGSWQHNPQHRGNAPYANKQTANKYGGTTRGEAKRPGGAGGAGGVGKPGGLGGAGGVGGAGKPGGPGGAGGAGGAGKAASGGLGKATGGGAGKPSGGGGKGAADKVGGHKPSGGGSGGAFAGGSGSSAKAASSRGGSSMKGGGGKGGGGKGGGGGGSRGGGGGGRSGGGKGGGGGRRR
jgi:hypothetical protein